MRLFKIFIVFLYLFLLLGCGEKQGIIEPEIKDGNVVYKDGDIIGHYSQADFLGLFRSLSDADFNHVGMIIHKDGIPYIYEATGSGVGFNSFDSFLQRGNGSYRVLRLKEKYSDNLSLVIEEALRYEGIEYDNSFDLDDDKIYCSELVYKSYLNSIDIEAGNLQKVEDVIGFQKYNPILTGIAKKFTGDISLDQRVVTPQSVMESVKFNVITKKEILK